MDKITDDRVEQAMELARDAGEEGLGVAAYLGDELIVNTWAGLADSETGRVVDETTLFQVFSGKGEKFTETIEREVEAIVADADWEARGGTPAAVPREDLVAAYLDHLRAGHPRLPRRADPVGQARPQGSDHPAPRLGALPLLDRRGKNASVNAPAGSSSR